MNALIAAAGILLVAAITPGPNNFVVMTAGARAGFAGALPALTGIVLGTLALVTVVVCGAGAAFAAEPRLRIGLAAAGCGYLLWLGVQLMAGRNPAEAVTVSPDPVALPNAVGGLMLFQFLNPKSWATVLAVTSAMPDRIGTPGFWLLAALFVLIPTGCLVVWAVFGSMLARYLERPVLAAAFRRAMGALLIVSALLLWLAP
jgi:threonine/homoserine/homoserine lactone efflux protein